MKVISGHESEEIICDNCGVIISDNVREKQAYTFFTTDVHAKGHNNGPVTLARHDIGIPTIIGRQNMGANGHIIDAATRCIVSAAIVEKTAYNYRKAHKKGRALYIACLNTGEKRTQTEVLRAQQE